MIFHKFSTFLISLKADLFTINQEESQNRVENERASNAVVIVYNDIKEALEKAKRYKLKHLSITFELFKQKIQKFLDVGITKTIMDRLWGWQGIYEGLSEFDNELNTESGLFLEIDTALMKPGSEKEVKEVASLLEKYQELYKQNREQEGALLLAKAKNAEKSYDFRTVSRERDRQASAEFGTTTALYLDEVELRVQLRLPKILGDCLKSLNLIFNHSEYNQEKSTEELTLTTSEANNGQVVVLDAVILLKLDKYIKDSSLHLDHLTADFEM